MIMMAKHRSWYWRIGCSFAAVVDSSNPWSNNHWTSDYYRTPDGCMSDTAMGLSMECDCTLVKLVSCKALVCCNSMGIESASWGVSQCLDDHRYWKAWNLSESSLRCRQRLQISVPYLRFSRCSSCSYVSCDDSGTWRDLNKSSWRGENVLQTYQILIWRSVSSSLVANSIRRARHRYLLTLNSFSSSINWTVV